MAGLDMISLCCVLLQALKLSLETCTHQTAVTARARRRLLQLIRSIIQSEAACSTTATATAPLERYGSTAVSRLGSSDVSSSSAADNPLQDALAGVGWQHAARAPLVVAALKVLSGLQRSEYQQEVLQLFPALCRLMCSNHMLIRTALHQVISSSEFLELLPGLKKA